MTNPEAFFWPSHAGTHRQSEISAVVGHDQKSWDRVTEDLLRWKVKTASGFKVSSSERVQAGDLVQIYAGIWGIRITEPVEVLQVVNTPTRVGFSYRTLPGHPVSGEEAFMVSRHGNDIRLTVRSLTSPAEQQPWRGLFPVLLIIQKVVRRRYLRSLS